MSPITPTDLSDSLDAEFSWRRREISSLKTVFEKSDFQHRQAIGRACYVALYAHWEGFVREAAQTYLHHVSMRSMPFNDLKLGVFLAVYPNALAHLRAAGASQIQNARAIEQIETLRKRRFKNKKPEINTRSNLRFEVLEEIDLMVGNLGLSACVDQHWLNERLVEKRNKIAHGREIGTDFGEFAELVDRVTAWMQAIKAAMTNAALGAAYRLI